MLKEFDLRDLRAMEGLYERTGLCPYTGDCESYKTIVNGERWMERALSRMRREGLEYLPWEEGGHTADLLQSKLAHMRQVKNRCYNKNGRCLRFWQFERRNQKKMELAKLRNRPRIVRTLLPSSHIVPVAQEGEK